MEFRESFIKGVFEIFPKKLEDNRGYFFESYQQNTFKEAGIDEVFVQDNQSFSKRGVMRGLHLQLGEYAQAKLVRVIKGNVLDIAVDIRKDSSTFGEHITVELSNDN